MTDQIEANLGSVDLRASAKGNARIVQIGGSVVTGNVFVGRYARLVDVWLDPAPVFEEAQIERFVGREWLLERLDRFLAGHSRGYFVIEADAGLGKTMLAAWLANNRDWVCHFTRRRKGRTTATALRNLAAQLIARYELVERFAPGGTLPDVAGEPGWFEQVLRAAAETARAAGGRLVVLVDGLDEAEGVAGDLPLGLPSTLPAGAYVVVTCRTGTDLRALRRPYERLTIRPQERNNLEDLRRYLAVTATSDSVISSLLSDASMLESEFAGVLLEACGGVWVYLRYVLEELRLGLRTLPGIGTLPSDLAGYYAESLLPTDPDRDWGAIRLPVLVTLAAAAEPLPVATLARLAGLADERPVAELCRRQLRPFLAATGVTDRRFAIYHVSLRDFLSGAGTGPMELDVAMAEELAAASTAAHGRIADHYLGHLGGLPSLNRLSANPRAAEVDDGYLLRHLTLHLERAGRIEELDALLAGETPSGRNIWYTAHDVAGSFGDYVNDIERALRISRAAVDAELATGGMASRFGTELHYTLVLNAVSALSAGVPPMLVGRLVASGQWRVARGLDHARRLTDPAARARALAAIASNANVLDEAGDLSQEILTAVRAEIVLDRRCWALSVLLSVLPVEVRGTFAEDLLVAIADVDDEDAAQYIKQVADSLPDEFVPRAVECATAFTDADARADALAGLERVS